MEQWILGLGNCARGPPETMLRFMWDLCYYENEDQSARPPPKLRSRRDMQLLFQVAYPVEYRRSRNEKFTSR